MSEKNVSAIAKSLEARALARKAYFYDASAFCSHSSSISGTVGIRVAVKAEEANAIASAERYLKKLGGGESVASPMLGLDARTVHILWHLVRDGGETTMTTEERETKARNFPAFQSADWMMQHLSNDEIATLLNLVNAVTEKESPRERRIDPGTVDNYVAVLAALDDVTPASEIMAHWDREYLEQFIVTISRRLWVEMQANGSTVEPSEPVLEANDDSQL